MIHKFKMFEDNVVLDVNSNSVYLFDDIAFEVLDYYEKFEIEYIINELKHKYNSNDIRDVYEEITQLKCDGSLFVDENYESMIKPSTDELTIKALCLHVAHDCNLRCRYCFASDGNYKGQRSLMNYNTGKAAIDFVINNSGTRRNIEIDFFGGEPLLNFEIVEQLVEYSKKRGKECSKNFRFTITTNAVSLNEKIKNYINNNMSNVVLSIDGRRDVNDKMRIGVDGKGSYDKIINKIKDMANSRKQDNYYVRGTFTRNNIDFAKDVLHLANEGFKQISIEPVVAGNETDYCLRQEDIPVVLKEYERLAKEYLERKKRGQEFNFFHFMIDLDNGPCAVKRVSGCGAGVEYVAITPEGDIYPCHQFVGVEGFKIGNVFEGVIKKETVEEFSNSNIRTKKDCQDCWAKYFCSGGCAANAFSFNNDINIPYSLACELQKKRIECAIWVNCSSKEVLQTKEPSPEILK